MSNPLIRKLEAVVDFTDRDRAVLEQVCKSTQPIAAGRDIIRQGDRPNNVHLVLDGVAFRYKVMRNGGRQIVAVLVPGDFCDLHVAILGEMDHSIGALTPCTLAVIPRETILDLTERHPRINRAMWWATLVDEGTLREWLTNIGQREAAEGLAHIFCELLLRLQSVGAADANSYPMPLRQNDLADVLGMTSVHVNRTLQALREAGLIVLERRRLTIPDVDRLKEFCGFDPAYLHLRPRQPEAVG
ncbi:hypothetical protein GOFOIKOB_6577 [Methylobacterium tardum]|uniref:Crp/Fnr family transcriptional regulator n=1 Tax=Methylobacterium tardum TaxID=374432 RepID=A0AA37TC87_9HYPH|nr:Crp/Fnr family transcriptional regulator [Methylobacterium tardum]URD38782.1 Crp/Fnr family transcriptional regulator [Methylobacterium tardum]GJE53496.1 hypothetical protein GOFOIKOB_6577 [Methylobacterium tardum]GLS68618.1 Crp/Fnr family transcriptional regulator [Methylobacterium tardum]